jgi:hypothetical protein
MGLEKISLSLKKSYDSACSLEGYQKLFGKEKMNTKLCKTCIWWNRCIGNYLLGKCERDYEHTFCDHSCNSWEEAIDIEDDRFLDDDLKYINASDELDFEDAE